MGTQSVTANYPRQYFLCNPDEDEPKDLSPPRLFRTARRILFVLNALVPTLFTKSLLGDRVATSIPVRSQESGRRDKRVDLRIDWDCLRG